MKQSFERLIAWQKAMDLAVSIYCATVGFPADERFGLTAQLRRAATSIPSDLAEGHGRLTTRDWQHFLSQARGSEHEIETQLMLAQRLGFGDAPEIQRLLSDAREVGRIINGLLQSTVNRARRNPHLE